MQAPPKFTNKLIGETSPYLLQHAHNPVDWHPWGEEAFAKAVREDKPVLVSIGYSACHWCHVMEHESFEDERAAAIQNEHFINIKVDMEERPDVDQIYMNFIQLTTGRGGWPMNVFLTPDKLPFFGGTYFPPTPRFNMPSWPQILGSIAEAWREKREELLHSANDILGELRRLTITEFSSAPIDQSLSENAYKALVRSFDAANGGFGGAPKFPAAMSMEFLLRYWKRTGERGALDIVRKTAFEMARGGIYDQLGGGFHRYAVDAIWLVPHFEKMLYDNAQLIRIYLHLFQILRAGNDPDADFFRRISVETLDYILREMTDTTGAFYSTQDADSEGHEGKFFVWTSEETADVLGEDDAREFSAIFDVTAGGNFEGKNILNLRGGSGAEHQRVSEWRQKLFEHREERIKPFRDEKVLTAWNGLMLSAFAEAAAVLNMPEYLAAARRNADFLLENLRDSEGRVLRTWKDGTAKLNGYIEDYANLADALIELYQVSGAEKYLLTSRELADAMIAEFWDEENGGFFFTSNSHEELIVRNKDLFDNATPSGNSVAAGVLLKLAKFFGDERYEKFGMTVLRLAAPQIRRFPSGFGRALSAVEFALGPVKEIAIIGEKGNDLECELWSEYRPFVVIATATSVNSPIRREGATGAPRPDETRNTNLIPLLAGRPTIDGKPTAYVCENFVCQRPVTDPTKLNKRLDL